MKHSYKMGVTLAVVSLALAGCTNKTVGQTVMEKTIEAQSGGTVKVDSNGQNMTIKTNDGQGQYSVGGNVKQPDNFPKELIVSGDAKLIVSSSTAQGSSLTYLTNDDKAKVAEKYVSSLTGSGWKKEMETNTGQGSMFNFSKESNSALIIIGDNNSADQQAKTTVNVTYTVGN